MEAAAAPAAPAPAPEAALDVRGKPVTLARTHRWVVHGALPRASPPEAIAILGYDLVSSAQSLRTSITIASLGYTDIDGFPTILMEI